MKKIIALFLVSVMIFCFASCSFSDYRKAVSLMKKEEYTEAIEILKTIEDYKDSKDLICECNYQTAQDLINNQKYEDAIEILKTAENYKDSKDLICECNYQVAKGLFDSKKYDDVISLLSDEKNHKESVELLKSAKYKKALELVDEYEYKEAEAIFTELGDYEEAKTMADKCSKALNPKEFNKKIIDVFTDGGKSEIDLSIKKSDSDRTYDVYVGLTKVGSLNYNNIDENGEAHDDGIINHLSYLSFFTHDDNFDLIINSWFLISPSIMCAMDKSYDNCQAALNVCSSCLTNSFSKFDSNDFNKNGYYYRTICMKVSNNAAAVGFSAATVELK